MSWVTKIKSWRVEGSTAIATRYLDEAARESEEVARVVLATEAQAREFVDNLIRFGSDEHRWAPSASLLGRGLWVVHHSTPELLAQYRREYENQRISDISPSSTLRIHPDEVDRLAALQQNGVSA